MEHSEIMSVVLFMAEGLGRKICILLFPDIQESISGFEILGSSTNKGPFQKSYSNLKECFH